MIQDQAEALLANGGTHLPGPAFSGRSERGRAALAAHRSHLAGGTGRRWLLPAAEMAGLASGRWRPSPDPGLAGWDRLPRIATCTPGAGTGSVRAARDFTVATLHRWGAAEPSHDIAVVVSELVTNALRHALPEPVATGPPGQVRLGLLEYGPWLLCAVADPSQAAPVPRPSGSLAETGRGLQMISALSDLWGYTEPSDDGKIVWAMFTIRRAAPSRSRSRFRQTAQRQGALYPGSRSPGAALLLP